MAIHAQGRKKRHSSAISRGWLKLQLCQKERERESSVQQEREEDSYLHSIYRGLSIYGKIDEGIEMS